MKTIKATTKVGARLWIQYASAKAQNVEEAYKRPSGRKIAIDKGLQDLCAKEGGAGYRIISAGTSYFTVAWRIGRGLRVETISNSYLVVF